MKTYFVVLLIATGFFYSCSGPTDQSVSSDTTTPEIPVEDYLTDEEMMSLASDWSDSTGGYITKNDAENRVKRYKSYLSKPRWGVPQKKRTYGFAIGKGRMQEFLNKMDQLPADSANPVVGFRVFISRKPHGNNKEYTDILFLPVLADGTDYYNIDSDTTFDNSLYKKASFQTDDVILNNSRPCPPYCGEQ
ncbi:MAG: hypothetical protein OEW75_01205 [Cyclobacteriaceae bacterium]|nr:hypothetical protein [Cyclobacteriaceae bacterium]